MTNESLKICGLQTTLVWEDAAANRMHFDTLIRQVPTDVDVIALPEMFTTGFSMHPTSLAEPADGPTTEWMQQWAAEKQSVITGSIITKIGDQYFNRLLWVMPNGEIEHYDKRHLFSYAGEHERYTAGQEIKVVEYQGWRICLNICYDLRFPVWSRNKNNYDILLYVANWPEVRIEAWSTLLRARAIENQAYTIGINRIGLDGNNHQYNGQSAIIDMGGNYLAQGHENESLLIHTLSMEKLQAFRQRFAFWRDADTFTIQ